MNNAARHELLTSPAEQPIGQSSLWEWLVGPEPRRFLLPATGLWILGLDWLLFSPDAVTVGLSLPATSAIGFLAGSVGAYLFQHRFAGNSRRQALLKAALAGLAVGIPLPITGTIVGAWIIAQSGLAGWRRRLRAYPNTHE